MRARRCGPFVKSRRVSKEDALNVPPDYDFPLETPSAKELAAALRGSNLVLSLRALPEPVVEIFRDQLAALRDQKAPMLVCMLTRGSHYRYYAIPFEVLVPLLQWARLSDEKRPRWRLNLVPRKHLFVVRNGPRVEQVDIRPYYNRH